MAYQIHLQARDGDKSTFSRQPMEFISCSVGTTASFQIFRILARYSCSLPVVVLVSTWLVGLFDPNGFILRFLGVMGTLVAFVAGIAQIRGRPFRAPWERR